MISAHGLARTFKTRDATGEAVRGIDFEVAAGEIVGLLGPNGAGKTTTQRMLSTLLPPPAGEATVAGCDLRRAPLGVRRQLGYVPSTCLDPLSRANLWTHITTLRDRDHVTILLTTHYLDEADALCDRILIIDHGKIVASGTPAELKRRISGDLVTFEVDDTLRAKALLETKARDVTAVA